MRDSELTDRPGKGWTTWRPGTGEAEIDKIWWAARVLHFPKLNVSCWFDGSDLVGIEHWGFRRPQWCMKNKPSGWQPLPEVYRLERERVTQEAIDAYRRTITIPDGGSTRAGHVPGGPEVLLQPDPPARLANRDTLAADPAAGKQTSPEVAEGPEGALNG